MGDFGRQGFKVLLSLLPQGLESKVTFAQDIPCDCLTSSCLWRAAGRDRDPTGSGVKDENT